MSISEITLAQSHCDGGGRMGYLRTKYDANLMMLIVSMCKHTGGSQSESGFGSSSVSNNNE